MSQHSSRAFTLIELLITVGIMGVLIALLLPALNKASEAAKLAACQSNIRQLAQAQFAYVADHQRHAPLWVNGTGTANSDILAYLNTTLADTADATSVLNCTKVSQDEINRYNTRPDIGVASYGMNPGMLSPRWDYDPSKIPSPADFILIAEQPVEQSDWAVTSDGMTRINRYLEAWDNTWIYHANHTPSRGYRHGKDGGNAAFNDGHVAFLDPQGLSLMGNDESPLRPTMPAASRNSRWIWWDHVPEQIAVGTQCSCGQDHTNSTPGQAF